MIEQMSTPSWRFRCYNIFYDPNYTTRRRFATILYFCCDFIPPRIHLINGNDVFNLRYLWCLKTDAQSWSNMRICFNNQKAFSCLNGHDLFTCLLKRYL